VWQVCLADCSRETQYQRGELQQALEVTADDFATSALHAVDSGGDISHAVDDRFVVGGMLVDARGTERRLTVGDSRPVEEIAGPLVYASGLAWIDLDAWELHPILGGGYWDWWGAGDTWFWGNVYDTDEQGDVIHHGLTWRNPDGSFGVRMLPIEHRGYSTQMLRSGDPGTMGAIEPSGPRRLLHVSTDYGRTWEVRVMPQRWGTGTALPEDWRTWVDVWPTWPTP
jgi:hypothetical protein